MLAGLSWFLGIKTIPISEAITIVMIMPIITTFLGYLLLNEKFGIIDIFCTLIGFLGIIFIMKPNFIFCYF